MTQIILNNDIVLPETSRNQYSCWEDNLTVQAEMINGRVVLESRGKVWRASYAYDYMGNDLMRQVLAVLRSGAPFPAAVLPDSGDQMIGSIFIRESLTVPKFAFSRSGKPYWHSFSFTIREEDAHD